MGAKYLNECTKENYIPVYVLVSGVFSLLMALLTCLPCGQKDNSTLKCLCSIWHILVSSFTFCWFIAGSVWIYSIYPPNYNSTLVDVPYCNKTLYLFAFWTTTLMYILLAVVFMCGCCYLICLCVCEQDDESEEAPEA
ncbi:transmembrane protein 272-like isoform 2-T6 [Clarias gariepinus]|uniref:transmembrane protein 272-like isoform X2 n=1 Tax=Clarias gariepinus TaxID=13013 RepID=UPI00234D36C1|nr:transmembrane protein 272-like isoform X2 [Clarias gariepinus]